MANFVICFRDQWKRAVVLLQSKKETMVVFTCSRCGDSVKKPQVEKHLSYRKCWGAALCCIDCLKDFHGDEYKAHNSCLTENERYGGKNYIPNPNVNKGQQKQQQWFEKVLNAIEKGKGKHPPWLQRQFERLKDYPNIPSKKAKFEAFLKNSLGIRDGRTASQIWEAIDQNIEKQVPNTSQQPMNGNSASKQTVEKQNISGQNTLQTEISSEQKTETEKKQSKRERKEERRKQAHKKEKKDQDLQCVNGDKTETGEKRKKKKKKCNDENDREESKENNIGKKRKFKEMGESVCNVKEEPDNADIKEDLDETREPSEDDEPARKKFKTKFDWAGVILEVLQGKDSEIKIKKLRKKVLAEYLAQGCTEKSEEKLWAKFDKRLKKIPLIKIQNDRVKLKK